jgi:glycosyl transferase family 25
MKTYVINLARAADRRAFMERQLAGSGLDSEFVDGVEGRALSAAEHAALVDLEAVARYPSWLTAGAIGCILSHKLVYDRIAASDNGPALVLEDDAVLPSDIAPLASGIAQIMDPAGVVLLNFRSFKPCRLSRASAVPVRRHAVLAPADPHQIVSTLAYLVGSEAAARMTSVIVPVRWAADSWGEYARCGAIGSLRCVLPRPVMPARTLTSNIRHDGHHVHSAMLERWPLLHVRQLNRRRVAWLMNRVQLID